MKKIFYLFVLSFFGLNFIACDQDVDQFDNAKNYIYFNLPYVLDDYGRVTSKHIDSLEYSFALEDNSVTSYTFRIPVNTIGLTSTMDRSYKVEVVKESSNATDEDWDATSIASPVIHAGKLIDTLYIKVNRQKILKEQARQITFRILPNENFQLGDNASLTAKISFSDILIAPSWWAGWEKYFGPYYREKFIKWQEIYYKGADPNSDTKDSPCGGKETFYWNNMPCSPKYAASSSPSTLMFIKVLKQYFIDNVVYPDGDTNKNRILLP